MTLIIKFISKDSVIMAADRMVSNTMDETILEEKNSIILQMYSMLFQEHQDSE
jgi:hypothetical protein